VLFRKDDGSLDYSALPHPQAASTSAQAAGTSAQAAGASALPAGTSSRAAAKAARAAAKSARAAAKAAAEEEQVLALCFLVWPCVINAGSLLLQEKPEEGHKDQRARWVQMRLDCLALKHFVVSSALQEAQDGVLPGQADDGAKAGTAGMSAFALCKKRKQQAAAVARSHEVTTTLQVGSTGSCCSSTLTSLICIALLCRRSRAPSSGTSGRAWRGWATSAGAPSGALMHQVSHRLSHDASACSNVVSMPQYMMGCN
jgi:hypothetical protein